MWRGSEIDASQYGLRSLLNNEQAVAIPIFQAPGSNAIQISDQVRATMEELKKTFPEGLDYSIVYDPTVFVRGLDQGGDPHAAGSRAAGGAGGDPVPADLARLHHSAAGRAGVHRRHASPSCMLFGFSINELSLFGLVLAIGIVVDDAIVVVENVERNIEAGLSPARRHRARR